MTKEANPMIQGASLWGSSLLVCTALLSSSCDNDRDDRTEAGETARTQPNIAEPVAPANTGATPANNPTPINPLTPNPDEQAQGELKAKAELKAAEGQEIEGDVELQSTSNGVRIVAKLEKAKPGKHGFHIHEKGDCSNIKGESMGGHFAPEKHAHALPGEGSERHLGDLGNIEVKEDGTGQMEITVQGATLKPDDKMSFLGKAVVVHMGEDMGKGKQPSGDSGTPIACGVIEKS